MLCDAVAVREIRFAMRALETTCCVAGVFAVNLTIANAEENVVGMGYVSVHIYVRLYDQPGMRCFKEHGNTETHVTLSRVLDLLCWLSARSLSTLRSPYPFVHYPFVTTPILVGGYKYINI